MSDSTRFTQWLLGAFLLVLAFGGGMWLSMLQNSHPDPAGVEGLLWPDPPKVPEFHLIDHQGLPFTQERMAGRWTLVFFGFTHCPDVCPTTLDAMAKAHQQLEQNPLYAERGQVAFISVDPERDTPEKLAEYVAYFSPDFVGISGGESELKALTRSLGVLFVKVGQGDNYSMDHSAGVFYVSPDLDLLSVLMPPHNAAEIERRFIAISNFFDKRT